MHGSDRRRLWWPVFIAGNSWAALCGEVAAAWLSGAPQPLEAGLLDALDATDQLPKTMLFCLNPNMNEVLSTLKRLTEAGELYGTLCGASPARQPVSPEACQVLRLFAGLIEQQIAREHLVTQLQQANAELLSQALTDPLTGLLNRRALMQELARLRALAPAERAPAIAQMLGGEKPAAPAISSRWTCWSRRASRNSRARRTARGSAPGAANTILSTPKPGSTFSSFSQSNLARRRASRAGNLSVPFQAAAAPHVEVDAQQGQDEQHHLHQAVEPELTERDRPRIKEKQFDIENQKQNGD